MLETNSPTNPQNQSPEGPPSRRTNLFPQEPTGDPTIPDATSKKKIWVALGLGAAILLIFLGFLFFKDSGTPNEPALTPSSGPANAGTLAPPPELNESPLMSPARTIGAAQTAADSLSSHVEEMEQLQNESDNPPQE
ncbi:MAG: hypothetical protein LBF22_08620 [Deltaproteobacteria bacterium]|jgi:hypothetical protein|nr:hypothetical protein [Deltaproteobacteria bacterium]